MQTTYSNGANEANGANGDTKSGVGVGVGVGAGVGAGVGVGVGVARSILSVSSAPAIIPSVRSVINSLRGATSDSVLTNPSSPIHCLAAQFQTYLHLPDPTPLYVTMGAMAGNMMTGTPVWLMLIGPPGCGKTEMLKSLLRLGVEPVSSISGEAALLSGTKRRDMAADASGGLLRTLGTNGVLVFMDFTSVLSKSREAVNELLGILRELFDKTWSRDIGGEGGRKLTHKGRVCMLAGSTPAIDRAGEVSKEMGERCLYFRWPETTGYQEGMAAVQDTEPDASELERQQLVEAMFGGLGMTIKEPIKRRRLDREESNRLVTLAQLGARCRSYVPRDRYTHQIVDVAAPEVATRMAKELTQLYCGMEALGNTPAEIWDALGKVALDSMSMSRRKVLEMVIAGHGQGQGQVRADEVAGQIKLSKRSCDQVLEDLDMLGVVKRYGTGWTRTDWLDEKLEVLIG